MSEQGFMGKVFSRAEYYDMQREKAAFQRLVDVLERELETLREKATLADKFARQVHGHNHENNLDSDGRYIEFERCTLWVCRTNREALDALTTPIATTVPSEENNG